MVVFVRATEDSPVPYTNTALVLSLLCQLGLIDQHTDMGVKTVAGRGNGGNGVNMVQLKFCCSFGAFRVDFYTPE